VGGSWQYGRFEISAKLPKGNFLWPAIWMLPTDNVYGQWAASGEIDIMEARGQVPNQLSSTVHYGGQWPNNQYSTSGDRNYAVDFTNGFHVFAVEWTATQMTFYVDGVLGWTQPLSKTFGAMYNGRQGAPFDQRFHMLLNVAVAG
jgi:beta-glucanase (GH16 family)